MKTKQRKYLGYEFEICPHHQILVWHGVYDSPNPFMKWTPE